ncbi:hypothetical protein MMC25_004519 [Agyrium rufum]|nr:hypothetical protein [Agyrium rufum]
MSISRVGSKVRTKPSTSYLPTPPAQNDSDDFGGFGSSDEEEKQKDKIELELERLLFGENEDFKKQLATYGKGEGSPNEEGEDGSVDEEERELDAVADADLFFIDSGPAGGSESLATPTPQSPPSESELEKGDPPAWIDSDDERITVSLASHPRLRKLRHNAAEDVINGRVYTRRLREQFRRLYPVPDWANPEAVKKQKKKDKESLSHKRKKRRLSMADEDTESEESSGSGSENDGNAMDVDLSTTTKPLAELLRTAGALTSLSSNASDRTLKLRPEVIDVQRLKDIGGTQPSPITSLSLHPTLPIVLIGTSPSSLLSLHHLSPTSHPTPNPLLTSIHLRSAALENTISFRPQPSSPSTNQIQRSDDPPPTQIYIAPSTKALTILSLPSSSPPEIQHLTRAHATSPTPLTFTAHKLSPCGRYLATRARSRKGGGEIHVLDASTLQWLGSARVEGANGIADFAWWADGQGLCALGRGGEVVEWSLTERRVVAKWSEEGGVGGTVIALGGGGMGAARGGRGMGRLGPDRYIAVGGKTGIVSVYDRYTWSVDLSSAAANGTGNGGAAQAAISESGFVQQRPKPKRTFDNLVTPISFLRFSPDGQLLVIASRWKRDALRLVHVSSCSVYKNFPTSATPLGRVSSLAVRQLPIEDGQSGGMPGKGVTRKAGWGTIHLIVGNEAGKCRMWEIRG